MKYLTICQVAPWFFGGVFRLPPWRESGEMVGFRPIISQNVGRGGPMSAQRRRGNGVPPEK